jgi:hypothetical protein
MNNKIIILFQISNFCINLLQAINNNLFKLCKLAHQTNYNLKLNWAANKELN